MKPIILGMDNPYSGEALWPDPPGCAGWNLWKLSDLQRRDYIRAFDRRNLMAPWDDSKSVEAARTFHSSLSPGASVVVLGTAVRDALGLKPVLVHPVELDGVTYRQIPHPSGRNLFYNHPANRMLIRMLLQWLIAEGRTATSA